MYTDRPRDFDNEETWDVLPGLIAIACDTIHRCVEIESCSGGEITKLSSLLRKIHRKFTPRPGSGTQVNNEGGPLYYSQRRGCTGGIISKTDDELWLTEEKSRGGDRCNSVLARLEQEDYTSKPFATRVEYVELVMALLHSPDYRDQMRRKNKGVEVRTMLARAVIPSNVEYLLNGSRYIMARGIKQGQSLPVGTATNEALAIRPTSSDRLYPPTPDRAFC